MTNFTNYKARTCNKKFGNPKNSHKCLYGVNRCNILSVFIYTDMTSLHDLMSSRVDNSGLPEGRL